VIALFNLQRTFKMKTFLGIAATAAVLAIATPVTLQAHAPATSQQAQPISSYTDADAGAVLNARLAALKAVIDLPAEQNQLWQPVETAIRDIVRDAAGRRTRRFSAAQPVHFLDVLGTIADAEAARGRDLRRFVDAARPLVASLTEAQRRRIPAFLSMTDHAGPGQTSAELWLFEEE
jgi:hypothetical protein